MCRFCELNFSFPFRRLGLSSLESCLGREEKRLLKESIAIGVVRESGHLTERAGGIYQWGNAMRLPIGGYRDEWV